MSSESPYRRPHPELRSAPEPCEHCGDELDARKSVLILADEHSDPRLYCVRPDCAQAFANAHPRGRR